jgi:PhzF family phenazine biosynthesis protein
MNISETAFVAKGWLRSSPKDSLSHYTLRWFTPTDEVELCGHATLATASVLFDRMEQTSNSAENKINKLSFETKFKGTLEAMIDWTTKSISLNFPTNDCSPLEKSNNSWIEDIAKNTLGPQLNSSYLQDIQYSSGTKNLLLRLKDSPESDKLIYKVMPNFDKLTKVNTNGLVQGVIVTQKSDNIKRVHFLSRYFAPWVGINEGKYFEQKIFTRNMIISFLTKDPVTGSAHTVLTPYWKRQYDEYGIATNGELIGEQCSLRKGTVFCKLLGERVQLTGKSRIVFIGEMSI